MKKQLLSRIALTSSVAISALSGTASATDNPFMANTLTAGYQMTASMEGKCGEGKCGEQKTDREGKCGAMDKAAKSMEGKCGEGKCGEDRANNKKADHEGKCGAMDKSKKDMEGKCGEGKCGAKS